MHMLSRSISRSMAAALLALALVFGGPAGASPEGAAEFVQRVADDVIGLVSDPSVPAAQRERMLADEFRATFDLATISRYTLGRYWDTATAAERAEYRAVFVDYLVHKYVGLTRFAYGGERLVVTATQAADARNIMVTSRIERPDGDPVTVVWQVRDADGAYLAIDAIVEGVSLVRALREEFTSVVRNNGGDVGTLIAMMRGALDETG